jgi:hypothetical protein
MDTAEVLTEIDALRLALEDACDAIMTRAEHGLVMARGEPVEAAAVSDIFAEIIGLCAFQDLAGQRLTRIAQAFSATPPDLRPDAHLLNGPADGDGLDQAAADALFSAQ